MEISQSYRGGISTLMMEGSGRYIVSSIGRKPDHVPLGASCIPTAIRYIITFRRILLSSAVGRMSDENGKTF